MALLGLHGFTGCDTVSAFHGKGKLLPLRTLLKAPKFIPILGKLGDDWKISEEVVDNLETFVCAMYGANNRTTKVDDLRLTKINKLCTKEGRSTPSSVDMATMPPCRRSLKQHILRANYQIAIWKRANVARPTLSPAHQGHGCVMKSGLQSLWYDGECQPQNLQDISAEDTDEEESDLDVASDSYGDSDSCDDTD